MDKADDILAVKARLLNTWGLRAIPPFRVIPSNDIEELMQVFVNREKELRRAILTLDDGKNILVRGMIGIGKTAFIKVLMHQMEWQVKKFRGENILPIHILQFTGGTREDFYRLILYSLAKQLAPSYKRAKEIINALTGEQITRGQSRKLSGGFEVQAIPVFKASIGGEIGGEETHILSVEQLEHFVQELIDITRKKYRRIIIAIDDLEQHTNQGSIKLMLESSLDLIRDERCSFILTGRPLTIIEDVYASDLGIFDETISLTPLSHQQLRLIATRTLNLVRNQPDESSVFPFSDEVIETIAAKSFGIPRGFASVCSKVLKIAIENCEEKLTASVFQRCFDQLQDEIAEREVPLYIRRIMYLGLKQGGFLLSKTADFDEVFNILGYTSVSEFVDYADNHLVKQDLLIRLKSDHGDILYKLAPGVEKLAQSGEQEKGSWD